MKNLRTQALCLFALLFSICSSAQNEKDHINEPNYNKPALFSNLPEKIPVSMDKINALLGTPIGNAARLNLADNSPLQFDGEMAGQTQARFCIEPGALSVLVPASR